MRKLLNTLYVTRENAYASLDGENIVITEGKLEIGRFPLHILEGIFIFSYAGASPALMGACSEKGILLVFLSPQGKFLCRVAGENQGNVLLRKTQYRFSDDKKKSCEIAKNFIFGKISNARQVLNRTKRDHGERADIAKFQDASEQLKQLMQKTIVVEDLDSLRGIEGAAATIYFARFQDMILQNHDIFTFNGRSRRPPLDRVNAMLSFIYVILGNECASALEMVGLDSYIGFMHRDHPGRQSLALDMLEEFRACIADRFVITLINQRKIAENHFEQQENGAILLNLEGRKIIQKEWQLHKQEQIMHPFLKERVNWGLVPYIQALLLSRYLRNDLEEYPPFLWK